MNPNMHVTSLAIFSGRKRERERERESKERKRERERGIQM
jgi:hypothetical protein